MGTRSCTILLRTFTKTGINFATRLELPAEHSLINLNVTYVTGLLQLINYNDLSIYLFINFSLNKMLTEIK